ncbi:HK97 gp10 family phage protein [Henriciella mobilis]|uniref:HK97 gp10 family phage protein n=1 Tax=Henriciella mobilis TaxID=2305467 RepID=UPI000E661357|nr:HK97 gp10 family phage protein [Henriciella mobilis]RIJ15950.1 HK97 gp10 family phage protein [Henriciella mobilis]RIJ21160.1 HK97 gp10 family phage protein [Henriciella mobilis]RIJ23139.1 HK97 gp10 family phage protein [Henriciella mobilis]
MAKFKGVGRHRRRLQRLKGRELVNELGKRVFVAADQVRAEAHVLIARGSVQGAGHVPSKPGEPPNLDTGLLTSKTTARRTAPLKAVAESAAPYSVALEYGTSKMAERPFMRPASRKVQAQYTVNISAGVNSIIRKG